MLEHLEELIKRGANGARIRLEPMKNWEANEPKKLSKVLKILESIAKKAGATISDTIILAGNVGLEKAIKKGGSKVKVPFNPGRGEFCPRANRN